MKNITNIYDVDGKLIRSANDNHRFTLEEIKLLMDHYKELIDHLSEIDRTADETKKLKVYENYYKNLMNYWMVEVSKMDKNDLLDALNKAAESNTNTKIAEALEQLKNDIDDGETGEDIKDEIQRPVTGDRGDNGDGESRDAEISERESSDVHEEG